MILTLTDLPPFVSRILDDFPEKETAAVLLLSGDLGAGKTTLVQTLAQALGVEERVTSPTFVISQSYKTTHQTFKKLVHIDAYRLSGEEKDTFGLTEALQEPETLIVIEWPEHLPKTILLPEDAKKVTLKVLDDTTREVTYA